MLLRPTSSSTREGTVRHVTANASPEIHDEVLLGALTGARRATRYGRYWARTSDLRLVEAALSQLS